MNTVHIQSDYSYSSILLVGRVDIGDHRVEFATTVAVLIWPELIS